MPYDFSKERADTNAALARELAAHTALSAERIEKLLPARADKARLDKLVKIVRGAGDEAERVAMLRRNIEDLGGVVVRVLATLL